MRRKKRDASRGSPGSFAAQKALAQDDKLTERATLRKVMIAVATAAAR
jgi:hypothetical protein